MQWEKSGMIGPTVNPVNDDILINESPAGRWLSIPISQEEGKIVSSLPRPLRDQFKKNVREYIRQLGQEYGNPPGQAKQ